jgi:hypothetical protein
MLHDLTITLPPFTSPIILRSKFQADFNNSVEINPVKRNVVGKCSYAFIVNDNKIDTIHIDAQNGI